ncbi:hypothetical protein JVT61DRAFT_1316 [Boletus reticuloceps]|uniref:Uncharacterized protein n=1 Tax=Boletus reticuloceps TaxID=495285 RepID=A0A8I3ACF2_9AGAM|nr:hypothetical protein JVT61DRAFT_1316 [Boletus reticuloceps]
MPTRISSKIEIKRKDIYCPKTRLPSQHKEFILPKSTKNCLGGEALGGNGKILNDPHDVADYVKIGTETLFRLPEQYLNIIQDQILSLLVDLPLDTLQVIEQFTTDHFAILLTAIAEEYLRSHAKLTYLEEDKKLLVMQPSSTHEAFIVALTSIIFTNSIGHNPYNYNFSSSLNKSLFYTQPDGSSGRAIPDYQLVMENNSNRAPGTPLIPKWIGEVSFTVSPSYTRKHLRQVVKSQPSVDLAFMIRIEELPKWASPSKDARMQKLRSQPFRAYKDFIPALPAGSLGPVVVEEFTWISITRVTFELYLHCPDGHLVVDGSLQDDYLARGILFPTVAMENVNLLLSKASECLIQSLISEMEASQEDVQAIKQVCRSEARLEVPWDLVLRSF